MNKPQNKIEENPMFPNPEASNLQNQKDSACKQTLQNRESQIVYALTLADLNGRTKEWYNAGYEFEQGIQYVPVGKTFMYVQVMTQSFKVK